MVRQLLQKIIKTKQNKTRVGKIKVINRGCQCLL